MKREYEIAVISRGAYVRTIRLYAPKRADRAIIIHDGQNVFCDGDATYKKSLRAIESIKEIGIKNTAVIGVDSAASRNDDYLPFAVESSDSAASPYGGKADAYMDYIAHTLIPYLDRRFGFKTYGMLGTSAGALATLYFAAKRNERVKAYGLYSSPLMVSPKAFGEFLAHASFDGDCYYHIYAGGSEQTGDIERQETEKRLFVADAFTIADTLERNGITNFDLEISGAAEHDEIAWRTPLKKFMKKFAIM